jgi:hypothetical protein
MNPDDQYAPPEDAYYTLDAHENLAPDPFSHKAPTSAQLLPLAMSYISSTPVSLVSLSRELKPPVRRMKFEGVGEELDYMWNKHVVPKKKAYFRRSKVRERG